MTQKRLDQILVHRGLGSRSEVKKFIRRGLIEVDGDICSENTRKFSSAVCIRVQGELLPDVPKLLVWHKPVGVICTTRDPWGRRDLDGVLPYRWRTRFHPVGRLDGETSGLLLFSSEGLVTQWLLHPRRVIERRYIATVTGMPTPDLSDTLARGVETSLGTFPARVVRLENSEVELVVTEGKHRMVRRILANSGYPVERLHRIAYGPVQLQQLAVEKLRPITAEECRTLVELGAPFGDDV
ncbi:MAG: pseudouridine synthase [Myxococcota bacterium]|nr:pseudouridine synthase [Myxococcota bacterium]